MNKSIRGSAAAPIFLAAVLAVGIIIFHLSYAWTGFSLYRDQHLGTALVYARGTIDLLRPVIIGFNASGTPTPLEFPLWQAAASLPLRWLGEWFGWANIISLLFFATAFYPVFKLGESLGGKNIGWWTVALLLTQPLVWIQAGQAGTDGLAFAAAVWFFYCGYRVLSEGQWWWTAATSATGALAATQKLPFMIAAGIGLGLLLLLRHWRELTAWIALAVSGIFTVVIFMLWTKHTDACLALAEFPLVDLRISHNPGMVFWYFGDWSYRLNPANWIRGGWRAMNALFGSFILIAAPLLVFGLRRARIEPVALLVGALVVTLIFSQLVLQHQNYFLMYSLPLALLLAPAASAAWSTVSREWRLPQQLLIALLVFAMLASTLQGLFGMEALFRDPYHRSAAARLAKLTDPEDRLLVVEGGWGGNYLLLSDRKGLSIRNTVFLEEDHNLERLRSLGFNKLVLVRESPLLAALQQNNPGNEGYRRKTYDGALTDSARQWTTLYEDEDMAIKQLP
jgi:4-amino-4-deoxy-L-arabinose transferase-like glycosyltransferase